jgi:hypothetical protein
MQTARRIIPREEGDGSANAVSAQFKVLEAACAERIEGLIYKTGLAEACLRKKIPTFSTE